MPAVLTEREGHLLIVTLNRPERMNAINGEMLVLMLDAFREADEDPDIRVVILTGAGGNFCSGADLKDMASGFAGNAESEVDVAARMAEDARARCDLPMWTWADADGPRAALQLALGSLRATTARNAAVDEPREPSAKPLTLLASGI